MFFQRRKFAKNVGNAAETVGKNLVAQHFIFKRGFMRWLIAIGFVLLSLFALVCPAINYFTFLRRSSGNGATIAAKA